MAEAGDAAGGGGGGGAAPSAPPMHADAPPPENPAAESVHAFLQRRELGHLAPVFDENGFRFVADILAITDADLREMGIAKLGERKAVLRVVSECRSGGRNRTPPPAEELCCRVDGHDDQRVKWFCDSCLLPVCIQCRLDGHPRAAVQASSGKRNHADHEASLKLLKDALGGELRAAAEMRAAAYEEMRGALTSGGAAMRDGAAAAAAETALLCEEAVRRHDAAAAALAEQRDGVLAALRAAQAEREGQVAEAAERGSAAERRLAADAATLRALLRGSEAPPLHLLSAAADIVTAPWPAPVHFPAGAAPRLRGAALDPALVLRHDPAPAPPDVVVRCVTETTHALAAVAVAVAGAAAAAAAAPGRGKVFAYQSDFDTNGVLHYIGTQRGTAAWQNPHTAGWVVVTMSKKSGGQESDLVDGGQPSQTFTDNTNGSWMAVDLKAHSLTLERYTLQNSSNQCHASTYTLRNWVMEGAGADMQWVVLDTRNGDASTGAVPNGRATFAVNAPTEQTFRHFRVRTTGTNAGGQYHHLMLSGIELYGTLTNP